MNYIWLIVTGAIVGALARWFMPGVQPMAWYMTIALGIGGAFFGGLLSSVLFRSKEGTLHPAGWVMSIVGAMLLLWLAPKFL